MARSSFRVTGIKSTIQRKLTDTNAESDADKITEAHMRLIANRAAINAPIDTGKLKASLPAGVRRYKRGTWELIAKTDYTIRQEYEHKTQKAFVRRAYWDTESAYKRALEQRFKGGKEGVRDLKSYDED